MIIKIIGENYSICVETEKTAYKMEGEYKKCEDKDGITEYSFHCTPVYKNGEAYLDDDISTILLSRDAIKFIYNQTDESMAKLLEKIKSYSPDEGYKFLTEIIFGNRIWSP